MAKLIFQKESDIENPIAFFEFFFKHNGYQLKLKEFYGGLEYVYDVVWEINRNEEYIRYSNNNSNGIIESKIYFTNVLERHLQAEIQKSNELIGRKLDKMVEDKVPIISYLPLLFNRLISLRHTLINSPVLSKHKVSLTSINQLILDLATNYKSFLRELSSPDISSVIEAIKQENKQKVSISVQSTPSESDKKFAENKNPKLSYFKWTANSDKNLFMLHNVLTEKGAIYGDGETMNALEIAFSGKPLIKPLKIKWRIKGHVGSTKAPLIKVIHLLMNELKLIEYIPEPTIFARTIENIFIDDQGSELKNVIQSMSANSKKANLKELSILTAIRLTFATANSSEIPRQTLNNP